jgi:hypothetical protein
MGVAEILQEIKSLPMQQRWEILERTREMLDAEIPESFKQGMREITRGEVIDLDEALEQDFSPRWKARKDTREDRRRKSIQIISRRFRDFARAEVVLEVLRPVARARSEARG